jgi:UDP-glucuronate 4-epimerase
MLRRSPFGAFGIVLQLPVYSEGVTSWPLGQFWIKDFELENKGKVLVTGTAGFIGYHLAKRLIGEGMEVVGLDNINDYYDVNLKYARLIDSGIEKGRIKYNQLTQSNKYQNYRFIQLSLEDKEEIDNLFRTEGFEMVVNLAAQAGVRYSLIHPETYIQSNITGFFNILECCRCYPVKHLVYASSSSVYGLNDKLPFSTSDKTDQPASLYAATKKSNELMAHAYSHLFQIPTTGLRFFTVYGPWGRPDMALFLFTDAILNNKEMEIYNFGDMIRDFTYIDDIIEGVIRVLYNIPVAVNDKGISPPYKVYNIGNHNPVNLNDFIAEVENLLGKKAIRKNLPMQPGDVLATSADVSDLEKDLGYKPSTDVKTGIEKFIHWYLEFYNENS